MVMSQWESWTLLHSGESMHQSSLVKSNLTIHPWEGVCVEKRECLPPATMRPLDINLGLQDIGIWVLTECCLGGVELGVTWMPNIRGPET